MLALLRPNLYVESFQHIDFEYLKEQGIRAICSDLDNTLVAWETDQASPQLLAWLQQAKAAGFELYLISNAVPKRFAHFAKLLGVKGIGKAGKPRRRSFLRALRELKLPAEQVALVGDQIFTDVLGGNRVGLFTILVVPLSQKEFIGTRFMRQLERIVMRWWSIERQS